MAGDEHEAEEIVAHVVVERRVEVRHGLLLLHLELVAEEVVLPREHLVAPHVVDGAMLGRGHEPGPGLARDAALGPALERGDECILRHLLGEPDVAHDSGEPRDDLGGFDAPDGRNRAMDVGSGHRECRGAGASALESGECIGVTG